MEKELNCSSLLALGLDISSEQLPNCYFNNNWDSPIDQNDPFESALSSMVSSPTAATPSNGGGIIPGDGMMIRELIGRLGSICDSGEISPQSCIATANNSTNTSCYSSPLNSPPKFNLSHLMMMGGNNNSSGNFPNQNPNLGSFNADPGFVERAAKFSCFGNNTSNFVGGDLGINNCNRSLPKLESGKLSRVSSNLQNDVNSGGFEKKFGGISRASTPENGEFGDSREVSSVSEQNPGGEMGLKAQNDASSRKRKSIPKSKVKESHSPVAKGNKVEAENEESNAKRSKTIEEGAKKENAEQNGGDCDNNNDKDKQNSDNKKEAAKPEPPKDYIHVRARRGQATDSHSLAERVRREKISERMKFLQDLVPGCNKVTGKATVLDEIINYVQSLQRQVEFLSMKLSTVNPRMEFNMEALLSKDMFQSRGSAIPQIMYPIDQNSAQAFPFGNYQSSQQLPSPLSNGTENPLSLTRRNPSIQMPSMDGFGDMSQLPTLWEDDLQSLVQMGIAQNQTQSVPGTLPNTQMKVEL